MSIEFVDPAKFDNFRVFKSGTLLIDVRDRDTHARLRLAESICIPLEELQATDFSHGLDAALHHYADLPADTVASSDQPLLLVCQLGRRAIMAAQFLESQVDNPLYVLSGGISACQDAGLELSGGDN